MLDNIKKYAPTYIPVVVTIAGIVAQSGHDYLTQHPHLSVGGFFAALGLAIVNHWIKSPRSA